MSWVKQVGSGFGYGVTFGEGKSYFLVQSTPILSNLKDLHHA
jgi:hypothetical protein